MTEPEYDELVEFRTSDRFTARGKAALKRAAAIAEDPGLAGDERWSELHDHFSEPELELGYFIGLRVGHSASSKPCGSSKASSGSTVWSPSHPKSPSSYSVPRPSLGAWV